MEKQIEELKTVIDTLQKQKDQYNASYEAFVEQTKELTNAIGANKNKAFDLETSIKAEAVKEYEKTGTTKFYGGVGIQNRKSIEYDDKKAFKWAIDHNLALSLNKTAFKKIAQTTDLDFVEEVITAKATFPPELKW